jgi:hypothetical protein
MSLCQIICTLWYSQKIKDKINYIIGETKRFMSYEIVKRLERAERKDLLKVMHDSVSPNEVKKNKIHNVFEPSADIKKY